MRPSRSKLLSQILRLNSTDTPTDCLSHTHHRFRSGFFFFLFLFVVIVAVVVVVVFSSRPHQCETYDII